MIIPKQELRTIVESSVSILTWHHEDDCHTTTNGDYRITHDPCGTTSLFFDDGLVSLVAKCASLSTACAIAQDHYRKRIAAQINVKLMAQWIAGTSFLLMSLLNLYTLVGAVLFVMFIIVVFWGADTAVDYQYLLTKDYDYVRFAKYLTQEPAQHSMFLDWAERNKE